jgi:hypothetical protein
LHPSATFSPVGEAELDVAKRDSFRWKSKPAHALLAVTAGLVLGAALFLVRMDKSPAPAAPSMATRPAGAAPSMAAPPAAPNPVVAAPALAGGKSKSKRAGLDDLGGKPRAGKQKAEAGDALVADPSDPFAPPIRLASKPKAGRAEKADADFIDPFAP